MTNSLIYLILIKCPVSFAYYSLFPYLPLRESLDVVPLFPELVRDPGLKEHLLVPQNEFLVRLGLVLKRVDYHPYLLRLSKYVGGLYRIAAICQIFFLP